jgi:hypothetical protein
MSFGGRLPPFHHYRGFLGEEARTELLDWTLANRGRFAASTLQGGVLDPARRVSERLRDLGPARAVFEERILALAPDIFRRIGTAPFAVESVELEIAAHGEGAHFAAHTDIPIGAGRTPLGGAPGHDRLLSAVYYYHREPKGFTGGALRLLPFGEGELFADLEPLQDSLVVFPSWARHEVRRVGCASGDFADYRFAVNCWLCRTIR